MATTQRNPYANPYTHDSENEPTLYPVRQKEYTEDEQAGPATVPGDPYAQRLSYRLTASPDPQRLGRVAAADSRVNPSAPRSWWGKRAAERMRRETEETVRYGQLPEQRTEDAGGSGQRFVNRDLGVTHLNGRLTAQLAPESGGRMTRPMIGNTPHRFNGVHTSKADFAHTNAEIYGMAPPRTHRSTVRPDLVSWGENRVVRAMPGAEYLAAQPQTSYAVPSPQTATRSMRLS